MREEQRKPRRGCDGQRPPVPQGHALLLPGRITAEFVFENIFGGFFAERNWRIFLQRVQVQDESQKWLASGRFYSQNYRIQRIYVIITDGFSPHTLHRLNTLQAPLLMNYNDELINTVCIGLLYV